MEGEIEDGDRCPACGAALGPDGPERCPSCDLAVGAPDDDETEGADEGDGAGQGGPGGLPTGWLVLPGRDSARIVRGEPPDDEAEGDPTRSPEPLPPPPAAPPPRPIRGRRLACVVVAGIAVVLALVALRRHTADPLQVELSVLASLSERPDGPPVAAGVLDAEAAVSEIAGRWRWAPGELEAARGRHRPLARAGSLHELGDAWAQGMCDLDPDWALYLGRHPHPTSEAAGRPFHEVALGHALLARDASGQLEAWSRTDLGRHGETDLEAARLLVEQNLRYGTPPDVELLWAIAQWSDPLVVLDLIECCPAADRAAAAVAHMRRVRARLDRLVGALDRPAEAHVLSTIRRLRHDADALTRWPAQLPASPELAQARDGAQAAARAAADRLEREVLPRADGPLGVGRDAYAFVLARGSRLERGPEAVLRDALEAMRAARRASAAAQASTGVWTYRKAPDPDLLRALSSNLAVREAPDALRWTTHVVPELFRYDRGEAYYLPAGLLAPPTPPAVLMQPRVHDPEADELAAQVHEAHVLAHETLPGHHLQHELARASACTLRRLVDDRVLVEGWAVVAEDLLHDADACASGVADGWLRADERFGFAQGAALDVLVHCRWASPDELLELLRLYDPEASLADLGDRVGWPGLGAVYFLGPPELARLRDQERARRGAGFDARAFHERLLRLGPLPPALLGVELAR